MHSKSPILKSVVSLSALSVVVVGDDVSVIADDC